MLMYILIQRSLYRGSSSQEQINSYIWSYSTEVYVMVINYQVPLPISAVENGTIITLLENNSSLGWQPIFCVHFSNGIYTQDTVKIEFTYLFLTSLQHVDQIQKILLIVFIDLF